MMIYFSGGYYCEQTGLSAPSGPCAAGYYCDGGATTSMPSGAGGSHCTAGYYCPEASAFAVACEPGYYCANDRLNETSGQCDGGYYCTSLAVIANPTDGTTGNQYTLIQSCTAGSMIRVFAFYFNQFNCHIFNLTTSLP